MSELRQYTNDEVRDLFLQQVWTYVRFWTTAKLEGDDLGHRDPTQHRVEGMAFSILAMLDGCSGGLPGFIVAPSPHESDEEYHRGEGENWFPCTPKVQTDIAGNLHEIFGRYEAAKR